MRQTDLRTFSKYEITRYIYVPDLCESNRKKYEKMQKEINKSLDLNIQKLSLLIPDRQIPFIKVNFATREEEKDNKFLRILVLDNENGIVNRIIKTENKTHFFYAYISTAHREIYIGREPVNINAELIVDEKYFISICVDIFLDIAMFNSYSFLRELPDEEKKRVSYQKYEYYKSNNLESFYHFREYDNKEPNYFSLAFAIRNNEFDFELEQYIYIWEEFLEEYYHNETNKVDSIIDQLKYHKSFGQITKYESADKILNRFDSVGCKLLLRINRRPKLSRDRNKIANYFGIPQFRCKGIKVKDISEYYNPQIAKYLEIGYISAFKVVVTKDNIKKEFINEN